MNVSSSFGFWENSTWVKFRLKKGRFWSKMLVVCSASTFIKKFLTEKCEVGDYFIGAFGESNEYLVLCVKHTAGPHLHPVGLRVSFPSGQKYFEIFCVQIRGHSNNPWHSLGVVQESVTKCHMGEWAEGLRQREEGGVRNNVSKCHLKEGGFQISQKVLRIIWMGPCNKLNVDKNISQRKKENKLLKGPLGQELWMTWLGQG